MHRLVRTLAVLALVALPAAAQDNPDDLVWRLVQNSADVATLEAFIAEYPQSQYVPAAEAKILALTETGESFEILVPGPATLSPEEIPRAAQRGLRLAGCNAGILTGEWNERSVSALNLYARRTGAGDPMQATDAILAEMETAFRADCGGQQMEPVDPRTLSRIVLEGTWTEEQVTRSGGGNGSKQKTRYIYRATIADDAVQDEQTVGINSPRTRSFEGRFGETIVDSANDYLSWSYDGMRLLRTRDRESYWTKTYFMLFERDGALACQMEVLVELKPGFDRVIARAQSSGAALEVLDVTPLTTDCTVWATP